ncbi:hypothetical protein [Humibacillus xanthopallidus]|uniref:Uncharacterized protein n=1 Tax=Humibacillus xanthopallidus TaxID=412689 RepID=A0A543HZU9_9MICO|nr:hypothetical protein [Humibacillus xanthopallidus]TQM63863.1 hypothetical protein FBY41_0217 [Humibacillus xanthopallidus]
MRSPHRARQLVATVAGLTGAALVAAALAAPAVATTPARSAEQARPVFTDNVAHDTSRPLSVLARAPRSLDAGSARLPEERGAPGASAPAQGSGTDPVAQTAEVAAATVGAPLANFEGLSNQDNFTIFGGRVNPPDPVGDVGPNHYVEMVNLAYAVYSKTGTLLLGPVDTGTLWQDFAVPDCTDPSGDPIVLYDQLADRWILSQFTTRGLDDPTLPFYNCVAVSTTGDPTGSYYRYAFETENFNFFPDYPKYGVWTDSYVITTREFGPTVEYGIGVYGLEKNKMLNGQPARAVTFFLDGNDPAVLPLVGDGLLPADIDGKQKPMTDAAIPLVGTQDDGGGYGATMDAVNVWDLRVKWRSTPTASLELKAQLPTAAFDSIFPCAPTSRDCLPQPGITNPAQYLDILSYRQRPTWRLAYRNFKGYESLVTTQSVEAAPNVAGMRWYELRRDGSGTYSLYQQGTYAPGDGVNRWMGSVAQNKKGDMALGYSVVNGTTVFPGIRYTGRLAGDSLGQMTLGEGVVIDGTGVQRSTNSRWGDYTSMNVDPVDDCTFWYVNEYYTAEGQASSTVGWQTRIASFKLPGC